MWWLCDISTSLYYRCLCKEEPARIESGSSTLYMYIYTGFSLHQRANTLKHWFCGYFDYLRVCVRSRCVVVFMKYVCMCGWNW